MKINKKIAAGALTLAMLSTSISSVFAFNLPKVDKAINNSQKIDVLKKANLIHGYADGSLGLDKSLTRSELTTLIVFAIGEDKKAESLKNEESPFKDVDKKYWANGIIKVGVEVKNAKGLKLIHGYPDQTFKGENKITYAELLTILDILKSDKIDEKAAKDASWPKDWIKWAEELKIIGKDSGLEIKDYNKEANRNDAFVLLYNTLASEISEKKEDKKEDKSNIEGVKKDVKAYLEALDKNNVLVTLNSVAGDDGFEGRIPKKSKAYDELSSAIDKAKALLAKKELTSDEEKELINLQPKLHEKKDKLTKGLAELASNFVVDWHVVGDRDFKATHGKSYTELKDNQIKIESKATTLAEDKVNIGLAVVKSNDYENAKVDAVSGSTPKYEKSKLDKKFYDVTRTATGFLITLKTNEAGFDEAMKDVKIIKPVVKVTLAETTAKRGDKEIKAATVIENGDLVFVK